MTTQKLKMREHGFKSIGKIYNRYTVIDVEIRKDLRGLKTTWGKCLCQCGNIKFVRMAALKSGQTKSCGCFAIDLSKKRVGDKSTFYKHGHNINGKLSPTLSTWRSMLSRCNIKTSTSYKNYGLKGVKICKRWLEFNNFFQDMGERPSIKHTIDRIDNSKGYSKENCRWATKSEQAINRKTTRFYTIDGETKCLKEWAKFYNIKYLIVFKRMARGWDLIESLTKPVIITKQNKHLS